MANQNLDTAVVMKLDKSILMAKNYIEILENKVVELGTENQELKRRLREELSTQASADTQMETEKEALERRWTNMRIGELD